MMDLPPQNILKAALETIFLCSYTTRNWTLSDEVTRQQINDLWEAVHEIPSLLTRWRDDSENELLTYLDEYDEKWPSPMLKERYLTFRNADPVA